MELQTSQICINLIYFSYFLKEIFQHRERYFQLQNKNKNKRIFFVKKYKKSTPHPHGMLFNFVGTDNYKLFSMAEKYKSRKNKMHQEILVVSFQLKTSCIEFELRNKVHVDSVISWSNSHFFKWCRYNFCRHNLGSLFFNKRYYYKIKFLVVISEADDE